MGDTSLLPDDPLINTSDRLEKTHAVAFETGADVTARQIVYEQGGAKRGLSLFLEDGSLYGAVWNTAEENWAIASLRSPASPPTARTRRRW